MILFRNGHAFSWAARCCPPHPHCTPFVSVEIAAGSGIFAPVIGKVDTGAFRTMLDFATAAALGLDPSTWDPNAPSGTACSATGQAIPYYEHRILVRIVNAAGLPFFFPLRVAFAQQICRNLFGIDWLDHLCLAVDRQSVYFLAD